MGQRIRATHRLPGSDICILIAYQNLLNYIGLLIVNEFHLITIIYIKQEITITIMRSVWLFNRNLGMIAKTLRQIDLVLMLYASSISLTGFYYTVDLLGSFI